MQKHSIQSQREIIQEEKEEDENITPNYTQLQSNGNIIVILNSIFNIPYIILKKTKAIESIDHSGLNIYHYQYKRREYHYPLFQSSIGNIVRDGLCIDDNSKMTLKRGWPKVYEYTEGENNAKFRFDTTLRMFFNELFIRKKINAINLAYMDILSDNRITISYITTLASWIISLRESQTVVVQSLKELDDLKHNGKVNQILYDICSDWLTTVINQPNTDELKAKCSLKTLVGYYINDNQDPIIHYTGTSSNNNKAKSMIVFAGLVFNNKHLVKYSRTPQDSEAFFTKFHLNYIKYERIASNINSIDQLMNEISRIYSQVSKGYVKNQMKGKIITISNDKRIISSFKIITNEWKALKYIIKKSLLNTKEGKMGEDLNTLIDKYKLPSDAGVYSDLFEYLVCNRKNNNEKQYLSEDAHLYLGKLGHPGINTELNENTNVVLFPCTATSYSTSATNALGSNYKFQIKHDVNSLSTEKDSWSIRLNNANNTNETTTTNNNNNINNSQVNDKANSNNINKVLDISSSIINPNDNYKDKNKGITHRSNNSETIDMINKSGNSLIPTAHLNLNFNHKDIMKSNKIIIKSKSNVNTRPNIGSPNNIFTLNHNERRVNFVDQRYNIPIASVVYIESYKKFNLGNRFDSDRDDSDDFRSNSTCCIIT